MALADAGVDVVATIDGIEIEAYGHLFDGFLSPATNDRDDEYGGSFENRARLLLRVTREVREIWPASKPLFVRISATDWADTGWNVDESVRLATLLKEIGVISV